MPYPKIAAILAAAALAASARAAIVLNGSTLVAHSNLTISPSQTILLGPTGSSPGGGGLDAAVAVTLTFEGLIADDGTGDALAIGPDPGTVNLGGNNTYSGGTTLQNGVLLINNTAGSGTGTGSVTLSGGTLGGAGIIAGLVQAGGNPHTIAPSATLASSAATTLSLGALSTNANTTLAFNLQAPGHAGDNDLLNVANNNALTLNGGALTVSNALTGPSSLGFYKIIQYNGNLQGSGPSSLSVPATQNNIAYTLDTSQDPGFIDIHEGFLGDANDDGTVDFNDFLILSQNFGQPGGWSQGNFAGDVTIDFNDFLILSQHFGQSISGSSFSATPAQLAIMQNFLSTGSPVSTPEPASLLLALPAFLIWLKLRPSSSP